MTTPKGRTGPPFLLCKNHQNEKIRTMPQKFFTYFLQNFFPLSYLNSIKNLPHSLITRKAEKSYGWTEIT